MHTAYVRPGGVSQVVHYLFLDALVIFLFSLIFYRHLVASLYDFIVLLLFVYQQL